MKKKLLILTSILLLLICIVIPVNAADATSNVNSQTAHRGDTVTFEATLTNSTVVGSGGVSLSYDSTVLKLVSGEWNVSGTLLSRFDMTKEVGAFAYEKSAEISGTIFTAKFQVLDTAAFGTTDVSLDIQLKDGSNADISVTNNSGSITVECIHDFSAKDTSGKYLKSSASCTSPAIYYYSCANCGVAGTATFESGSTIPHSYRKQVIRDDYIKTPASCTAKAVYYYCCETCDAKGAETFEYGEVLAHTFDQQNTSEKYLKSAADCENAAVYYKSCSCGEKGTETFTYGDKLGHTGGTATCTSKAICSRCGKEYGDLLSHTYNQEKATEEYLKSGATCTQKAVYYKSCTCGAKGTETFESGNTIPHSYKKQVITDDYIKTPASCTAKAVYYYCCETCDAKGAETFEYGEVLAHTFDQQNTSEKYLKSAADCENAAVYYKSCSCGEKGTETFTYGDKLGHTGGTATCTSKAICSRCGKEYGDLLSHTYNQEKATEEYLKSGATCTQKAVYYKSCTCGAKGTMTFEYGTTLPHTYDQKVITNTYLKSAATCTAKAVYYYSCTCGAKGTDTFEAGDEPSHSYKTVWSSNSKEHWHECSKCGDKKDIAAHTPGAQATEYTAQTCTVCGYVITPAFGHTHSYSTAWEHDAVKHWHTCSGCSEHGNEAEHVYDNACDTTCNVCGYVRTVTHSYTTEWMQDGSSHWHECTVCHEKSDEANHIPGAEATETTAQTCTVCGYVIKDALGHTHSFGAEWKSDATTHWHECTCGEKSEQAPHVSTGDNIASCTKKAVCDICGAEYGETAVHEYSSEWKNDADNHWHECSCGDKGDIGAHTWDAGVVTKQATTTENGVKKYTCTVCGQEKTESIDKLTDSNDTTKSTDDTKKGCGSTVTIGLLIPAIFVPAWIIKKRK